MKIPKLLLLLLATACASAADKPATAPVTEMARINPDRDPVDRPAFRERCPCCGRPMPFERPTIELDRARTESLSLAVPGPDSPSRFTAAVSDEVYTARNDTFLRLYAVELAARTPRETAVKNALDAASAYEAWLGGHQQRFPAPVTEQAVENTTKEYQDCYTSTYREERNRQVDHQTAMTHAREACTARETRPRP